VDDDFLATEDDKLPLSPEFSSAGFPFSIGGWSMNETYSAVLLPASLERLRQIGNTETRSWLASAILSLFAFPRGRKVIPSPSQFQQLYALAYLSPSLKKRPFWLDGLLVTEPKDLLSNEWIDFFNWLGREGKLVTSETPRRELVEGLIHHFCVNPEGRRGLLPIIAALAAAGCRCAVPRHILELAKSWSPCAKDDAIGLSLAGDEVVETEIVALAEEISKSASLDSAVWQALRMASASSLKQAARFALALLGVIDCESEHGADAADSVRRILIEFLTNKPSLIQDPIVWKRLNLPERI
jgi:hypothetical protein